MILLAGGILSYFIVQNHKKAKQTAELQKELADYEQKALHLQMNPHFVFNCLAAISAFIVQNSQQDAIKYLSKFSKLMRLTLDYSKTSLITLNYSFPVAGIGVLYLEKGFKSSLVVHMRFEETAVINHNYKPAQLGFNRGSKT